MCALSLHVRLVRLVFSLTQTNVHGRSASSSSQYETQATSGLQPWSLNQKPSANGFRSLVPMGKDPLRVIFPSLRSRWEDWWNSCQWLAIHWSMTMSKVHWYKNKICKQIDTWIGCIHCATVDSLSLRMVFWSTPQTSWRCGWMFYFITRTTAIFWQEWVV